MGGGGGRGGGVGGTEIENGVEGERYREWRGEGRESGGRERTVE